MNIAPDPKSVTQPLLSPEANQAAALAARHRRSHRRSRRHRRQLAQAREDRGAGRMRRRDQGRRLWLRPRAGGPGAGRRRLQDLLRRYRWTRPAPPARRCRRPRSMCSTASSRTRRRLCQDQRRPVIGDLNELAEWDVFCRRSGWEGGAAHPHRHRHEPARPDASRKRRASSPGSMPAITASRW